MKKVIFLTAMAVILSAGAQAQKNCTEIFKMKSEQNSKSRGKSTMFKTPSRIVMLPETLPASRGKGHCTAMIENTTGFDINVYVDSVYVGSLEPNKKGQIAPAKGAYKIVHFWTSSGDRKWHHNGSCPCQKTFVLE